MRINVLIDGVRVYGSMWHNEFRPDDEYEVVNISEMYAALQESKLHISGVEKTDFATWAGWIESSGRLDNAVQLHLNHLYPAYEDNNYDCD